MSYLSAPAVSGVAVTPSDSVNLAVPTRALYIGSSGGNITAIMNGAPVLFTNVQVGILPIRAERINATGTTATNIVALS
jgi:hypothetical protein